MVLAAKIYLKYNKLLPRVFIIFLDVYDKLAFDQPAIFFIYLSEMRQATKKNETKKCHAIINNEYEQNHVNFSMRQPTTEWQS